MLLEQINNEIAVFEDEMAGRWRRPVIGRGDAGSPLEAEQRSQWWRGPAACLVQLARDHAAHARIDAARDALHNAKRLSLYELNDQELDVAARTLRAEIENKLMGWRQEAALKALESVYPASDATQPSMPPWPPHALTHAQELLDEYDRNVYVKLRVAGRRLLTAATLLLLTILGLWVAVRWNAFGLSTTPSGGSFVLNDSKLFLGVLLLGVFGAMLSLALDLAKSRPTESRIYELTTARIAVPVARLSIGAGSAVLVVAAAQAAANTSSLLLYLTAIPAAFSERLVRRSVDALESSTTKA
ncbi:hypothetical protein GCM10027053_47730 [Intrasporangium mesophilum]